MGQTDVDMGPLITREHRDRVAGYLDIAAAEGASVALDGRRNVDPNSFLIGPSVVDRVTSNMRVYREEIFGPVLSVVRARLIERSFGYRKKLRIRQRGVDLYSKRTCRPVNQAALQRRDDRNQRIGVPAPMAWFPFTGWNRSFFGDLHMQGREGIWFYTQQKTTLTRLVQIDPVNPITIPSGDRTGRPVFNSRPLGRTPVAP